MGVPLDNNAYFVLDRRIIGCPRLWLTFYFYLCYVVEQIEGIYENSNYKGTHTRRFEKKF